MIKKLIRRLLGKRDPDPVGAEGSAAPAGPALGRRTEVPREQHGIDQRLIDERALKVVATLRDAGYEAYLVGGAVRDLLLGLRPKDFDVATNATPEQVKGLFRRAFVIGRRFRLVHVVFGRGREHEVIEVSTFRAYLDASEADQVAGNERTSRADLAGKTHVVDASGRVLRDNVWGPQNEDAARRDFTVNALYYDPQREVVVDYHGGFGDAKARLLRMIGDPAVRFREDPVRIIRAVRFAAKLGFDIEPKTRAPMKRMADLLPNIPQSRLFDEMIKLLQTGHALASLEQLRKEGLHQGVFPLLDAVLADAHRHDGREKFIHLALADTDRRVAEGKPVAPSFMLASMLWHDVLDRWQRLRAGMPATPALQQAIDEVFNARIGDISGRGKLAADMREIWMMQPRFERRTAAGVATLVEQPRFRAGFDFMRLRADAGETEPALAQWWESYSTASPEERQRLVAAARQEEQARRAAGAPATTARAAKQRPAAARAAGAGPAAASDEAAETGEAGEADDQAAEAGAVDSAEPAVRKRRRRRRKPAREGADGPLATPEQ